MLVTEHVPAQEKHNIVYLKKKGVLLSFKNSKELKRHIADLCENPKRLNEMSKNTLALKKPAILDLAEVILSQPTADYDEFTEQCKTLDISKKAVKKALKLAGK